MLVNGAHSEANCAPQRASRHARRIGVVDRRQKNAEVAQISRRLGVPAERWARHFGTTRLYRRARYTPQLIGRRVRRRGEAGAGAGERAPPLASAAETRYGCICMDVPR